MSECQTYGRQYVRMSNIWKAICQKVKHMEGDMTEVQTMEGNMSEGQTMEG